MFSRDNPSPRYRELLVTYQTMHRDGFDRLEDGEMRRVAPKNAFPGSQLPRYADPIKVLVRSTGAQSILDYGAGKGKQYEPMDIVDGSGTLIAHSIQEYWGVEKVLLFDPGVPSHNSLPDERVDGLVCTDVLEHIPREDVFWVVEEMFSLVDKFVFANVACYAAAATLPDGSNAHVTVVHPQWWAGVFETIAQRFPSVSYQLMCLGMEVGPNGKPLPSKTNFGRIVQG